MKTVFKENDRVFDFLYGWGTITFISTIFSTFPMRVIFDDEDVEDQFYTLDGKFYASANPTLSFTEYKIEGFSQTPPLPEIPVDTLIYVKESSCGVWEMRYFSHFDKDGTVWCFSHQTKSSLTQPNHTARWSHYSLTNPLEDNEMENKK